MDKIMLLLILRLIWESQALHSRSSGLTFQNHTQMVANEDLLLVLFSLFNFMPIFSGTLLFGIYTRPIEQLIEWHTLENNVYVDDTEPCCLALQRE